MAKYKLLKRPKGIVYFIKTSLGITKVGLLNTTGHEVSERTLELDSNILKTDFSLDISYVVL
jgi:hypothetical protein